MMYTLEHDLARYVRLYALEHDHVDVQWYAVAHFWGLDFIDAILIHNELHTKTQAIAYFCSLAE
jgi:hypothetical protein